MRLVPGISERCYSNVSENLRPRLVVLHGNARGGVRAQLQVYGQLPPDVLERLRWMGEYPLDHM